ncbi:MFS transporter [Bordetella parapertussis]|uniref:Efflux protein n=5 Tax=Bordetella TaxID=517 RepID=A0A0H3LPU0_BORBR|nr:MULTISPECIES: MFS transporter [Bordetella]SHS84764.1 Probable drug resistance transporter, EmrB/QacA subfamily [Mycobacteroides abscessus subsp. abscessus]AMG89663.1 MFS transporter [Bordetella bronchiseptica]AOB40151.1 multidrug MFS transporter [Bordetella parapertussis]AUL44168.1 MFS transporter [Bordetella parapertussis]AWP64072.1 MFS transporter [Bordetella parapertussis]
MKNLAQQSVEENGLSGPRQQRALVTVTLGVTIAVMDGVIANTALPLIAQDLAAPAATSIWIVNAYQIALFMALLPLAVLGESLGYRRVYLVGLYVFTGASLMSALAGSLTALVLARVMQGLGTAGILSVNLALIRYIVPRERLGRAIGMNATVAAIASTAGPVLASVVLSIGSWPWLFAIGVPAGIAAILTGSRSLPESHRREGSYDWRSAILSATAFGLALLAVVTFSHRLPALLVLGLLGMAIATGWFLVRRQRAVEAPLLPLDLLRKAAFSLSLCTSICSFAAQTLAYVGLPFYYQLVLGFNAVDTGILLAPWPLALAAIASSSGRLADRWGAAVLGSIGMALLAAGLLLLAALPREPAITDVLLRMAICGAGFGLFQPANNRAIMGAAPPSRSGAASGMLGTARLLGQAAGAALVAYLLGRAGPQGAVQCLYAGAACAGVAGVISLARLRRR